MPPCIIYMCIEAKLLTFQVSTPVMYPLPGCDRRSITILNLFSDVPPILCIYSGINVARASSSLIYLASKWIMNIFFYTYHQI